MAKQVAVTQRAYTLRLRGVDPKDQSWRDALWRTHEAVNNGAKAFGDWLLTLRGGLGHTLADAKVKGTKGKSDRDPTDEERKARRILLALSWLSVESKLGAPTDFIIASGEDTAEERNGKVPSALEEILKGRGVKDDEINSWKNDCLASLSAAIRDDAVWVNRSKAFDENIGASLCRDGIWDMLEPFFGSTSSYLAPTKDPGDNFSDAGKDEKAKDLVQKAGQWLSSRFGTGKGADFHAMSRVYKKIAEWAGKATSEMCGSKAIVDLAATLSEFSPASNDLQGVLDLISGPGYKSATRKLLNKLAAKTSVIQQDFQSLQDKATDDAGKCGKKTRSKGPRPYANAILKDVESACGFTYRADKNGKGVSVAEYSSYSDDYKWGSARHVEFTVMLDHAARRVSLAHTWIKRAEAERRQFEEDGKKMANVPDSVKRWLDIFCRERSGSLGALESYRIRRRAVDGWKAVVAAWTKSSCATTEDRIAAVRALQDDPEMDKFGDIQLFELLAADDALCVWHKDGDPTKDPDHQPLMNYVLASEAEYRKRHFKIPAYRHPDALLHPVFCDFGNSRWEIDFSIREAQGGGLDKARQTLKNKQEAVKKAQNALKKCEGKKGKEEKERKAYDKLAQAEKERKEAKREVERLSARHCLEMKLWNKKTKTIEKISLLWQSKRLAHDLAFNQGEEEGKTTEVTRADRLGRAAAGADHDTLVSILALFEQKDWNGRLQAPRRQLEAIAARVEKHGWDEKARKMRDRLQWLLTFSAKLQPQGPWGDFAEGVGPSTDPKYWPHAEENKKREGHARLILSRLPGLRILSVDLGHRYAAACVIWETLSREQVKKACQEAGRNAPAEGDLYLYLKKKVKKHKRGKEVEIEETTVYRRIGADMLPDGKPHPAPWARLDRQFLIKLQGEEKNPRKASHEEIKAVEDFEKAVGRPAPENRSLNIADLMRETVCTARLALQRHGRRARIAFNLTARKRLLPGGQEENLTNEGRVGLLSDTLTDWCALFTGKGWCDEWAKQQWDKHIVPLLDGADLPQPAEGAATSQEREKRRKELRGKLEPVAEKLDKNSSLCMKLHCLWDTRWREEDKLWKKRLRWLRDWILPRGKKAKDRSIRHVGGLSLTRVATIKFLYQVQKAFHMRPEPKDLRKNIPAKGDDALRDFGRSILDTMEHMREQRVKQLASRITEAALGIGRIKRPKGGKDTKRPRARVDKPCHAVVIENLTHYRPDETRTRRENRQLMSWSSAKVRKYLAEACELHGLHLREVSAAYTSQQDSRTGAPGLRCQDVPVKNFMQLPFWRKQVAQAEKKQAEGKGDAHERFLCELNAKWKDKSEAEWKKARAIRIPLKGGEIFVSAESKSPATKGLQADLNAAANIGLRALLDPDWPGRWWYVPCDAKEFKPVKDKLKGCRAIDTSTALKAVSAGGNSGSSVTGSKKKDGKRSRQGKFKDIVNLWCDSSGRPIEERATKGEWFSFAEYWNKVQCRVVRVLRSQAGLGDES